MYTSQRDCGNKVSIPYPFEIGNGCYVGDWFEIVCRNDSYDLGFPKPFLKRFNLEVLEIDIAVGKIRVNYAIFSSSKNHSELEKSPFVFSDNKNSFVVMGCNNSASLRSLLNDSNSFEYDVNELCENMDGSYRACFEPPTSQQMRAIVIGITTSFGVLFLLFGGWWSYKLIKKRKMIKQKEKFFKRNGGLLLQLQLSSSDHVNVESNKLFSSKDLEEATDRFNANRILGRGGQGTVYKGMLSNERIVAVKRSVMIDEEKLEEFVNEVVILSRINHRNVVKLLGCCLETEIPLLVYEFVPNGTLAHYLDDQNEFLLTWGMRLRIATEVAGALFYLHSAASSPIYHRDIKTTNILLDEKYRAKVTDFGTSRSIAIDQTHLTTLVYGTFGYLDLEYFQSSQFIEKSDVYSFGVVLAELLTGEKAISSKRTLETKSLATYFLNSMEENNLFDIIDNRVLKEAKKEEIIAVANLVKRCLNLSGKKRPTMKKVAKELEGVLQMPQNLEEVLVLKNEMFDQYNVVSTSTIASKDSSIASSLDTEPLLSSSILRRIKTS
ncbi:wall-associated receptor kinase-like 10 [Carya illinoinensis]|uniref:wall-associated receptor kinase-like 10 n=1 Tax=Carya illinoinensis TaxID=32201 RepID=UPI001C71CBE0|nr:wall-associated receptor kinase-like 10 [Carya illinoinensis]